MRFLIRLNIIIEMLGGSWPTHLGPARRDGEKKRRFLYESVELIDREKEVSDDFVEDFRLFPGDAVSCVGHIDLATAAEFFDCLFCYAAVFVIESAGDPENGAAESGKGGEEIVLRAEGPITESLCNIQLVGNRGLVKPAGGKAVSLQDFHGVPAAEEFIPVGFCEAGPFIIIVETCFVIGMESGVGGDDDRGFPFFAIGKESMEGKSATH